MEKLKTQEAAFPTFPQGLPPENEPESMTRERTKRRSRRSHERIILKRTLRSITKPTEGGFLADQRGGKLGDY